MTVPMGQSICNQIRDAVRVAQNYSPSPLEVWIGSGVASAVRDEQRAEQNLVEDEVPWMLDGTPLRESLRVPVHTFYVMLESAPEYKNRNECTNCSGRGVFKEICPICHGKGYTP